MGDRKGDGTMRISILALAAAATFALSLAARADASADGSRTFNRSRSVVQYADLDIATEQGAKILLLRIERAARKACGGHPTFSSYTGALDNTFMDCRDKAVQRAVIRLGSPTVTRMYAETKSRES